jgi:hypothetical protein
MPPRRWLLAALSIALVPGCHRAPAVADAFPTASRETVYPQGTFTYDVTAVGQHLRGRVTIEDSIVILEPVGDSCPRRSALERNWRVNPVVSFWCTGLPVSGLPPGQPTTILTIHLAYPQTRSRWSRVDRVKLVDVYRVPDPRSCLRWSETRRGTPVCLVYDSLPTPGRTRAEPVWENGLLSLMSALRVTPDTGRREPPATGGRL